MGVPEVPQLPEEPGGRACHVVDTVDGCTIT